MSSVRVRRGSLYSSLSDNGNSIPLRPRSRTVTSIRNLKSRPHLNLNNFSSFNPDPLESPHHHSSQDIRLHGDQADVIISNNERQPQRGSVLSLASFMSDQSTDNEDDHDHDIVDHLEAIGMNTI